MGGADAVLVIDDTGVPKKGTLSVGVAPQYCGELGKQANCQSLVSLTLARHEVPVPVGLRLFRPKVWTDDPVRCAAAGVPEAALAPQTKPEIALAEIDRVIAAGARFGCVLADAGYGCSGPFRRGLSARGLVWSVGAPRTQKVYSTKAEPIWPTASRGRPRKQPVPSEVAQDAASALAGCRWRRIAWRQGAKGALSACRVANDKSLTAIYDTVSLVVPRFVTTGSRWRRSVGSESPFRIGSSTGQPS